MKWHLLNAIGTAMLCGALWLALPIGVVVAASALSGALLTLWAIDVAVRREIQALSERDEP